MPFESLSEKIQFSLRKLTGRGKVNEKDIEDTMREIRVSLLEADVNYKIVKEFINEVKTLALGEKVMKSLTPGDQVVKIVYEELVKLMGEEAVPINLKKSGMSIVLVVGLQGSGKTTHVGKLANYLRKNNKLKPLMIAADVYRPAAINQLVTIGKQLDIEVFQMGILTKPQVIVKKGLEYAKEKGLNLVLIDTAGRLQIDDALMTELENIGKEVPITETILLVDAMSGQDAVNVAKTFNERLKLTGLIMSKLDGDSRGGSALSIKHLTGVPIKFAGTGEKLEDLEVFYPERMADRILGMGDIVSLIEKAQENIDEDVTKKTAKRMMEGKFDLDDMVAILKQMKKLGKFSGLLKMIPNMPKISDDDANKVESILKKTEVIINSMTKEERKHPEILKNSRKQRIAKGSGTTAADINKIVGRFDEMKKQMALFSGEANKMSKKGR